MNIRVDFYIILIVLCTIIDLFSKVILLKERFLFLENTQKKKGGDHGVHQGDI